MLRGDRLQASRYHLYYKSGKRARTYDVRYSNGNITSTTVNRRRAGCRRTGSTYQPGDMRSVLDPISGLIFPADANVCAQKLPIYDGEMRMDLVLSPKGSQNFSTEGFSGKATVCNVRFVPRSGYKKGRSDIEYLSKSSRMEIWFAKADAANVYAPVYVRIPTQYGPVTITAVKYGGKLTEHGVSAEGGTSEASGNVDRVYGHSDVVVSGAVYRRLRAKCRRSSFPPSALPSAAFRASSC